MKDLFVYILTNPRRTTLYIGVTNDLASRIWQHQNGQGSGFSKQYQTTVLIYRETYPDPLAAIAREKQLKGWTRKKKEALIATTNPEWRDLSEEVFCTGPTHHGHSERSGGGKAGGAQSKDLAESPATSPETPRGPSTARLSAKPERRSAQDDREEET